MDPILTLNQMQIWRIELLKFISQVFVNANLSGGIKFAKEQILKEYLQSGSILGTDKKRI